MTWTTRQTALVQAEQLISAAWIDWCRTWPGQPGDPNEFRRIYLMQVDRDGPQQHRKLFLEAGLLTPTIEMDASGNVMPEPRIPGSSSFGLSIVFLLCLLFCAWVVVATLAWPLAILGIGSLWLWLKSWARRVKQQLLYTTAEESRFSREKTKRQPYDGWSRP